MNFSIQPEFFYTSKDRIQIMITYKESESHDAKKCSRWAPLHGFVEFNEFHDIITKFPNIYNILGITIQLRYDREYFIYYFDYQNNKPLTNIYKENNVTIFLDYYPRIVINNILIPFECKVATTSQDIDFDDDCVIL